MVARICDLPLYLHYHRRSGSRSSPTFEPARPIRIPIFETGWSIDVECCGKFDTPFEFHRFPIFHRRECLSKFCFTIPTDTMLRVIGRVWIPRVVFPQVFEIFETIFSERWNHRLGKRSNRFLYQYNIFLVVIQVLLSSVEFVLLF